MRPWKFVLLWLRDMEMEVGFKFWHSHLMTVLFTPRATVFLYVARGIMNN